MMDGLGIDTGISLDDLVQTGQFISDALGRPNGSKVKLWCFTKIQATLLFRLEMPSNLPAKNSYCTNVYMIFIDNKLVFGEVRVFQNLECGKCYSCSLLLFSPFC